MGEYFSDAKVKLLRDTHIRRHVVKQLSQLALLPSGRH